MNAMPKYVFSRTLEEATWNNSTVVRGDIGEEVRCIKNEVTGDILVAGSRTLVHNLLGHGLVDELQVMVFPVVLGSGRRLYPETSDRTVLELVDTRPSDTGFVLHAYRPLPAGA